MKNASNSSFIKNENASYDEIVLHNTFAQQSNFKNNDLFVSQGRSLVSSISMSQQVFSISSRRLVSQVCILSISIGYTKSIYQIGGWEGDIRKLIL